MYEGAERPSLRPDVVERPDVVVVLVDEWRQQAFSRNGDPNAVTPALDRFADDSVVFEQAISGNPVCCPARASFMTGQYPLTHGVYINDVELDPGDDVTLAEAFGGVGYRTAYIGKWHLYGSPEGHFERRGSAVPDAARLGFQYWKAAECSHDYNNSIYYDHDDPAPKYWDGYDVFSQTDAAIEVLTEQSDKPLFLMLSFGPPHFPLGTAPERFHRKYADREIALPPNVPADQREKALQDLRGYYAHIEALDEAFARLLGAIDLEKTVVVFTSDHGDMLWSQGVEYKLVPWDESLRVPLYVHIPGRGGESRQDLFNSPDLMPTLLGLAAIPIPRTVQGRDVFSEQSPASAFLNVPVAFSSLRRCGFDEYRGVRTQRYTYVRTSRGPWLLYDNVQDPNQLRNEIGNPDLAERRAELENELRGWLERLDDDFLPGDDYLRRDGLEHYFEAVEPLGYCEGVGWRSTNPRARLWSIDSPIADILTDDRARAVLAHQAPALCEPNESWNVHHSPRIAGMARPDMFDRDALDRLDAALGGLEARDASTAQAVAAATLPPRVRLTVLDALASGAHPS